MTGAKHRSRGAGIAIRILLILAEYWLVLRPRQLRWGATDEEVMGELPGDDLMTAPDLSATRGITVRCRAAEVWPWIAQLGQGRGGFYSYDALENLVGCDIHSADRIVPEWQDVRVGDQVRLAPEVGLEVALVDPGHALILQGGVAMGETAPPYDFTWAFVLQEQSEGTTRLLVRERYHYRQWWARLLVEPVEIISFVMSQEMLHGIRDRAERRSHRVPSSSNTESNRTAGDASRQKEDQR